jgi:glycosyltransferase involved in cell wall biosynthesis
MDEQIFAIQAFGGISRMFAELARQYVHHGVSDVRLIPFTAPIVNRYILDDPAVSAALGARAARNEWTALARYFARLRVHPPADVIHNTFYLPHGLAPTRGAKRIVTVHDMIPELLPGTRRRLDKLTLKRRYVDQADHIICVSEATRRDLLRVYPEVSAPITVVHHGVDERFTPGADALPDLPDEYVLMVGHRGEYKDGALLFRAFAQIADTFPDVDLVCVGGGAFTREEQELIDELGLVERVGQYPLSDPRLPGAYGNALAFVFPSRFEGFGLPALEAMACGAPTILSDSTAFPEIGGEAAAYFTVGDPADLANVMETVLSSDERRRCLREQGLQRAAQFSWRRTAEETASVYRQAVQAPR